MKTKTILLLIITFPLWGLLGCSKDNPVIEDPLANLPPETQTGANKVGCLVNGKVLLPPGSNPFGPPVVTCFYQNLNNQYQFSMGFSNNQNQHLRVINVASRNIEFLQGQIYQLREDNGNNAFAGYLDFSQNSDYLTTNISTGELKITKLDQTNAINFRNFLV